MLYEPAAQGVHVAWPAAENVPAGHAAHEALPAIVEKEPAAHGVQVEAEPAEVADEDVPAAHATGAAPAGQ